MLSGVVVDRFGIVSARVLEIPRSYLKRATAEKREKEQRIGKKRQRENENRKKDTKREKVEKTKEGKKKKPRSRLWFRS